MFKWQKLGRIFDPTSVKGKDWLKEFAQAPDVQIFDSYLRVYFSCRSERDHDNQYISYSSYIDLDRKNLFNIINIADEPILNLGQLGTFDQFGTYPVSTIKVQDEIHIYYGGWTRCESTPYTVAIGKAISTDEGKTFKKIGSGPLLSSTHKEPFEISGPKIRRFNNKWYLWYVAGTKWHKHDGRAETVFKIRMATSDDGMNWSRSGEDIIDSKLELDECQASPDVFYQDGRYHMFFCYKHGVGFRESDRGYRIGYAFSDNLTDWVRDDEKAGIDISEHGWDNQSIAYPHVFKLDHDIYMLYLGNHVGKYGFGLAKLQLNNES
jgi:predicted GH43/DUF377 family glycosyl hydrolase